MLKSHVLTLGLALSALAALPAQLYAAPTVTITANIEGTTVTPENPTVTFTITSSEPALLSLGINGTDVATKENATEFVTDYTFTKAGSYNCYGNAKTDEGIGSTLLRLTYVVPSPQVDYPGGVPKMGAVRNADGSTTFCVGAPEKLSATIMASWNNFAQNDEAIMNYQDYEGQRYFWTTVQGLEPDQQYFYYYLFDGTKAAGDPYARLVLDPTNDRYITADVYPDLPAYPAEAPARSVSMAVYQHNINDYDWQVTDFKPVPKDQLMIYELLIRDFTGAEGKAKGTGTLRQAMEKLPYLKTLGINAIELMPVNEFNGNNSWGYNPNFYFAPDKAYGTPDDYKEFIDLCHQNGIAVFLDMVFNQCDWQHPWYQMYDTKANPMINAVSPHEYNVLNDWNQGHALVRQQWKDVVKYWITEYKVDGFRFDLVKGLGDNDSYGKGTEAYNSSRVKNMQAIQEAMLEANPDAVVINENLAGAQEENEMAATGMLNWSNNNNAGCQFAMGYNTSSNLNSLYATKASRLKNSTVSYLESHDEERMAYKQRVWGVSGVKGNHANSMLRLGSTAAQLIMTPGAHMIWQFGELGNDQTTKASDGSNSTSPKFVYWSYLDDPDRAGLYNTYCELIRLRNENSELFSEGTFEINCSATNWANGRSTSLVKGDQELYCFINPNVAKDLTMKTNFLSSDPKHYMVASKSYNSNPSFSVSAQTVTIPANCYVVIASTNVTDVDTIGADAADSLGVYGTHGAIVVDFAPADVTVYDLNGRTIYNGAPATIDVAAGLYIVKSGAVAKKVMAY